jgi:ABC-type transport system involved in cytochrome bd biosynthesis fused ATPase/permease subunit
VDHPRCLLVGPPCPPGPDGRDRVLLRGAVIIRVRGRVAPGARPAGGPVALGPELATALAEPASRPGWALLRCLRGGAFSLGALAVGLVLAAGGVVLEALLLRGAIGSGRDLGLVTQRIQAVGLVLAVAVALLLIERGVADNLARLGRHLEGRLRLAFLAKIPRLHDRYFQSRPISDMAGRSHTLHQVRLLPRLAGQFLRAALTLGITAAAIARIDPAAAPAAALAAVVALGLPLAFTPVIQELDLRARTHAGALSRFYLDALLGLAAVRAHGAEWPVRREHESLLVEWARASQRLLGWVVAIEGWQLLSGLGFAGWLLRRHTDQVHGAGAALLLAYWALNIPVLGEEIALLVRQYPSHRNVTLRLLEPLGAPEDDMPAAGRAAIVPPGTDHEPDGVAITFDGVTVRAAGQMILQEIDLRIAAGSQVAIVGASGAGKSSLVGLLLGWHRAAVGRVLIDGEPLDASRLDRLRGETAWVEPAVQLWNRSLAENLLYGTPGSGPSGLGHTLEEADLYEVLRRLPEGLQTSLGEGGGCLSGGEGQRVRFGRALSRPRARLVLLDEPFRGLDRERRRALLHRARRLWPGATLLCITHDVGETCDFDRVLVLEAGRVAEDGPPGLLAQAPTSRYRALLDAEEAIQAGLWSGADWCRLRLEGGRLYGGEPGGRA